MEGAGGFRDILAPWAAKKLVNITAEKIVFPNQAAINLCYCKNKNDLERYQGAEINMLGMDELTHFEEYIYKYLVGRCRLGSCKKYIPKELQGKFPFILSASNPSNRGHFWVKEMFVDYAPEGEIVKVVPNPKKPHLYRKRQFIASRVEDNPYLEENYETNLLTMGDENLVKAMRYGDWNVLQGSFFSDFYESKVVIEPFKIPVHWAKVCAMDWGFFYPFSVQWWAIAAENFLHPLTEQFIPAGSMVMYREWYGLAKGQRNRGIAISPQEAAKGILERTKEEIDVWVADPKIWKSDTGKRAGDMFADSGIFWRRGNNVHETGWMEVKSRIRNNSFFIFKQCFDSVRCFTNAVCDDKNPSEIDVKCEIHPCDTARYAAMEVANGIKPSKRRDCFFEKKDLTFEDCIEYFEGAKNGYKKGPLEI